VSRQHPTIARSSGSRQAFQREVQFEGDQRLDVGSDIAGCRRYLLESFDARPDALEANPPWRHGCASTHQRRL
jgi:hypothetical protein